MNDVVVAYEPVWAIGTGNFAKPHNVEEAVAVIRHNVREMFGDEAESQLRVLYGGSVTPDVAQGYLEINGVDGLLVGGASLNYEHFSAIAEAAHSENQEDNHGG